MKLLTAIFSYNRYFLLRNSVESFYEFGPGGDLLIVDDGSDDPRIQEYLCSSGQNPGTFVMRNESSAYALHGGLYGNMNRAVDFAMDHGYSHIFFVQDDMQFMWKDDGFQNRALDILESCPNASIVSPLFQKAIVRHTFQDRFVLAENKKSWHLKPYGIADVGLMPLSLIQKHSFHFENSEGNHVKIWKDWGYKAYTLPCPNLAWVPWPRVMDFKKPSGRERAPIQKYFLKPLSESQILKLQEIGTSMIPCHEDFCFPWGWSCLTPYWFTNSRREYVKLVLVNFLKGRGSLPTSIQAK